MRMALQGPNTNKLIQTLVLGFVFLWVITQFINLNALTSDADEDIFKTPGDDFVGQGFQMLIAAGAVYLAWIILLKSQSPFNRKTLIMFLFLGIALWFLYTKVLVGLIPGLPSLETAAVSIQSMIAP